MIKKILFIIIILGLFVRLIPLDFPYFSADEARIAVRGYFLTTSGTDELGRKFPLIFNSLNDYQLPVVSYLTALGILIFGKTDLGVRAPFIMVGVLLIPLIFQIAKFVNPRSFFWLISAGMVAISPGLIFLSKVPNDSIVLVFILTLLFYLLIGHKNIAVLISTIILAVLTSKLAWFVLLPYVVITLYGFQKPFRQKRNLLLIFSSVVVTILALLFFINIPQSIRSLQENNFSFFSDLTIQNGLNRSRGQGIESNWHPLLERLLFNKSQYLSIGFLHWLSHLSPTFYFGQFDDSGRMNFSSSGVWFKVLLIPLFLGIFFLIRKGEGKIRFIIPIILVLTYPALFSYPNYLLQLGFLTAPFIAIMIAYGFIFLQKKVVLILFFLLVLEWVMLYHFSYEFKNANLTRPKWIVELLTDASKNFKDQTTYFSDDMVEEIIPFLQWYQPQLGRDSNIAWPYKFRQNQLGNIKIIGLDETFTTCGIEDHPITFVSNRDLIKIKKEFEVEISKSYQDSLGGKVAYLLSNRLCLR